MMREEIIRLWLTCFEDTEEFARFYFNHKYREENTLVSKENDKIIAALQMIPYPMKWNSKRIETSYISGACTLPEARNRGIMKQLLMQAFAVQKERHIAFTILIPQEAWLYDFYRKLGYSPVFGHTPLNIHLAAIHRSPAVQILEPDKYLSCLEELYTYFDRQIQTRPNSVLHPIEDFTAILEDLYLSHGRLFVYRNPAGKIKGMAFALSLGDKIRITELLYDTEEIKSALLHTAASEWNDKELECITPPAPARYQTRGMARIIDATAVLQLYAATYQRKSILIHLSDVCLPSNNGYYNIHNGQCTYSEAVDTKPDLEADAQTLTQMLFEHPAFINLMLD